MNMEDEWPDFDSYSYETLLDVHEKINGDKFPNRKAYVAELISIGPGRDVKEVPNVHRVGARSATIDPKYDTFIERFFAGWIDGFLLTVASYIAEPVLSLLPIWLSGALVSLSLLSAYVYSVTMHSLYGQTIGKMFTGVRVVTCDYEQNIRFKAALLRDIVPIGIATLMIVLWPDWNSIVASQLMFTMPFFFKFVLVLSVVWTVIELITMLSNEKRRALHDFIAGTVVIKTNKVE